MDHTSTTSQPAGAPAAGPRPRVLIAEDQPHVLEALQLLLTSEGFETVGVASPRAAVQAVEAAPFDVVLLDLNYARDTTSGAEGLELLGRVLGFDPSLPVVVMTAWGSIELAVEAMQRGARDFIQKPWENDRLLRVLRHQVAQRQARRDGQSRQDQEIEEAHQIQMGLLPSRILHGEGFEIHGAWLPARVVGGDHFDVLRPGPGLLGLCIGDAVGKGLPAAMQMVHLHAAVRATAYETAQPALLVRRVNEMICDHFAPGRFVTFFYALLDAATRRLDYVNAGHNPPLLVRADGTCERLEQGGPVLGEFREWSYEQGQVALAPGDRLVLFTDGLTEAHDGGGNEFGEARLRELLVAHRHQDLGLLQETLIDAVKRHSAAGLEDDATCIIIGVG